MLRFLRLVPILLLCCCCGCATIQPTASTPAVTSDTIIVTGASGELGSHVISALLKRGVPARQLILVSRTPEKMQEYVRMGARARYGDFFQPQTLPAAFAGGQRMLLISVAGNVPTFELHKNAIDAAVRAGVKHIAYTSILGADTFNGTLAHFHLQTERYLKNSGVGWTLLRNGLYADRIPDRAVLMVTSGHVVVPADERPLAYVTHADLAEAAAVVLTTDGHDGEAYELTGPELIDYVRIAGIASQITGKPIAVERVAADAPLDPTSAPLARREFPSMVSPAIQQLTGHAPMSVRALLEADKAKLLAATGKTPVQ